MSFPPRKLEVKSNTQVQVALARLHADTKALGFTAHGCQTIMTAASELMQNTLKYADGSVVRYWDVSAGQRIGIEVEVQDDGPGIPDLDLAFKDNYSTSATLGLGLPGVRRLVDHLDIKSSPGEGTTATFRHYRQF